MMQWRESRLQLQTALSPLHCALLSVHPWTPGAGMVTRSGHYLSPQNAVGWLTGRLSGATGTRDVVALLLTATNTASFQSSIAGLAGVLPLPEVESLARKVRAMSELAVTRMQLPARSPAGLPEAVMMSTRTTRQLQRAAQAATAAGTGGASLSGLSGMQKTFSTRRAALLGKLSQASQALTQARCQVWSFCARDDVQMARLAMQERLPHPDHVLSLGLLFVGADLSGLRGMLSWDK